VINLSKWEKLLAKITTLSKDVRFAELKKILENYGYEGKNLGVAAAIEHSENKGNRLSPFRRMNP
jgi:hypothetical protein